MDKIVLCTFLLNLVYGKYSHIIATIFRFFKDKDMNGLENIFLIVFISVTCAGDEADACFYNNNRWIRITII